MKTNDAVWSVVRMIANRWKRRQKDIKSFVGTECSFEEWLNWEAFCACKSQRWTVTPKPTYPRSQKQADLMIDLGRGEIVWIEIGHVHDKTKGVKWLAKLNADRNKLNQADKTFHRVQLVLNACELPGSIKAWSADLADLHKGFASRSDFWLDRKIKVRRVLAWKI